MSVISLEEWRKKQVSSSSDGRFVVKKDIFEQCLVLFPIEEWETAFKKMHSGEFIKSVIKPA